ncbi:hypothetical protein CSW58_12900, partial [Caulobacter sp. B11]|uniref:hypothetical protein n=1 Tax=Caulobacter sp. B11 TaxID=2048899 RepID=UPI000C139394
AGTGDGLGPRLNDKLVQPAGGPDAATFMMFRSLAILLAATLTRGSGQGEGAVTAMAVSGRVRPQ